MIKLYQIHSNPAHPLHIQITLKYLILILIIPIALALIFELLSGVYDSSKIIATMVSSRWLRLQFFLSITAETGFIRRRKNFWSIVTIAHVFPYFTTISIPIGNTIIKTV